MNKFGSVFVFFIIIFSFILASCYNTFKPQPTFTTNTKFYKHVSDSIVGFPVFNGEDNFLGFSCTGFFISPKHIMTARHCILRMDEIEFAYNLFGTNDEEGKIIIDEVIRQQLRKFKTKKFATHKIFYSDKEYTEDDMPEATLAYIDLDTEFMMNGVDKNDIAILEVTDPKNYSKDWLNFSLNPLVGQEIMLLGMHNGKDWFPSWGHIGKLSNIDDEPKIPDIIVANILMIPGCSGSPLLNRNGEIVGLASSVQVFQNSQIVDFGYFVHPKHLFEAYKIVK